MKKFLLILSLCALFIGKANSQSWTADNGNGTFTNPLFYDEFTDPDLIRVDTVFYMVASSMHAMPGLPLLRSKDLVNWEFVTYIFDKLDLGPEFHLEGDKGIYGNGIWAPAIRYHKGTFYVFVNVNDHGLQVFSAQDPSGPWIHKNMGGRIYDLGILFDDDDKIYAVHSYDEVKLIEIKPDFSGYVEGSEKVIIPKNNAMGEGHHFYKINGKYYIISADYAPVGRMQCARADKPEGPYETVVISSRETMGTQRGWWSKGYGFWSNIPNEGEVMEFEKPSENGFYAVPLHQGGIVDLPNGEWWGFSMMDVKSTGRLTFLSPVIWKNGWPYFGLEGNLGRSPRTWFKPDIGMNTTPITTYKRDDDFSSPKLQPIWQWNHIPVDKKWSLTEKKGMLRLHTLPAKNFMYAKNTLTQRVMGPESNATVVLDVKSLKQGDVAGLALLNVPYYWIGVIRTNQGLMIRFYDLVKNQSIDEPILTNRVYLRANGNYDKDIARLSFSTDGVNFKEVGDDLRLGYQMKTFQGVRYALFAFNTEGKEGGYADFDSFKVEEPLADRSRNLPIGKIITLTNLGNNMPVWAHSHGMLHSTGSSKDAYYSKGCQFRVHDRGKGRIALESMDGSGFITVVGEGLSGDVRMMKDESEGSLFLWQDMLRNECMLLSLKTNKYVGLTPETGEPYSADWAGSRPDRKDGAVFEWKEVKEEQS
ncbi:glycoside hydrolase family 43 protein [Dysgonomonas capnocytophagoides]|uniref:glycoside hydrolase family 43 protein n=1 Tax=Dysgonomonas capnocytophagoides TaxID=45254 RepID=UPI002926F48E|nr:glycoside hydrolase 43 family protein [Dysgonomonas capnocytophagoides]